MSKYNEVQPFCSFNLSLSESIQSDFLIFAIFVNGIKGVAIQTGFLDKQQ